MLRVLLRVLMIVSFLFVQLTVAASMSHAATTRKGFIVAGDLAPSRLWYVSPVNGRRYDLGSTKEQAMVSIKKVALGITNADLSKIPTSKETKKGDMKLRSRLAGRFLLAIQDRGMIWYVSPSDLKRYYFAPTGGSYLFLRSLSMTALQGDIEALPIGFSFPSTLPPPTQPAPNVAPAAPVNQTPLSTTQPQSTASIAQPIAAQPVPSTPIDPCATAQPVVVDAGDRYLIITRPKFVDALQPFVRWKSNLGTHVQIVTVDDIACQEKSGDVPSRIRSVLAKAATSAPNLKYVLLVGGSRPLVNGITPPTANTLVEDWEVPIRYINQVGHYPTTQPPTPTDQYYASPNGDWNTDPSQLKGFDFAWQYAVGRVPAQSSAEVTAWVQKTMNWNVPTRPKESQFKSAFCGGWPNTQNDLILSKYTHAMTFNYCQHDNGGDIADISNQQGADFVSSYSHGSYEMVTKWPGVKGYDLTKQSPGFTKPPVMFIHGCEVAGLDYPTQSLGAKLLLDPNGVVAFIGSTRSHWDIIFPYWETVFHDGYLTAGDALYATKQLGAQRRMLPLAEVDNYFMFNLFGDPQLELIRPDVVISTAAHSIALPANSSSTSLALSVSSRNGTVISSDFSDSIQDWVNIGTSVSVPANGQSSFAFSYTPYLNPIVTHEDVAFPLRSCRPEIMSCVVPKVIVSRGVDLSCARFEPLGDGRYQFQVRAMNSADRPFSLVFKARPGKAITAGKDIVPAPGVMQTLPERYYGAGETVSFSFNPDDLHSDAVPTVWTDGLSYIFPYYVVEATNADGGVIGSCWMSPAEETQYK